MQEIKKIKAIQSSYFQLLDDHFKKEREDFELSGKSAIEYSYQLFGSHSASSIIIPSGNRNINSNEYKFLNFIKEIKSFWSLNKEELTKNIKKSNNLFINISCLFQDIPYYIRKYAVYFDSLCIPEDLSNLNSDYFYYDPNKTIHLFAERFSNYLGIIETIKQVPLDDEDLLFIVYPSDFAVSGVENMVWIKESKKIDNKLNISIVKERFYWHYKHFFEEVFHYDFDFDSAYEVQKFAYSFPKKLLFPDSINRLIELCGLDTLSRIQHLFVNKHVDLVKEIEKFVEHKDPQILSGKALSVLCNLFESALLSTETTHLDSTFLGMETHLFPGNWGLHKWKLKKESDAIHKTLKLEPDTMVAYIINSKLEWLSNLTLKQVKEIRRNNQLSECRDLLRGYKNKLSHTNPEEIGVVSREIEDAIVRRFDEYKQLRQKEDSKKKLSRSKKYSLFFIPASLGIVSLAFPAIFPLALTSTVFSLIIGGKSIKDLYKDYKEEKKLQVQLDKSALGILVSVYEKKNNI